VNTSLTTFGALKPSDKTEIPEAVLSYFRTRNRMRLFTLVHQEFEKSGVSQADLAARLAKGSDRICRILGAPGNWTVDTVSDFLFALSGAEIRYTIAYPLRKPTMNMTIRQDAAQVTIEPDDFKVRQVSRNLVRVNQSNPLELTDAWLIQPEYKGIKHHV
jgi:hypothetical protein